MKTKYLVVLVRVSAKNRDLLLLGFNGLDLSYILKTTN